MNLFEMLIKLYEDREDEMLPLYHSTASAQVTVFLDKHGNFVNAEVTENDDKITVIPVTEASNARTNNNAPHALCDELRYITKDVEEYTDWKWDNSYLTQLKAWIDSPYSHPMIESIYRYLEKGCVMNDLIDVKVLEYDKNGNLKKIKSTRPDKIFVRFCVDEIPCWKEKSLYDAYIGYCRSNQTEKELSYMTGNKQAITYLHPKKIRFDGDQTKLLSGNNSSGFTFRGRFRTQEEAYAVGIEDSHKMHNALKWLIRNHGTHFGELYIVTWEENGEKLPEWNQEIKEVIWDGKNDSFTHIIVVDAANSGRLSIQEYSSMPTSHYLENLKKWYEDHKWRYPKKGEEPTERVLSVRETAELLYGREKGNYLSLDGKEALYQSFVKRWMPCILKGKPIPKDIIALAVKRASSPQAFKNRGIWWKEICFACSLVKTEKVKRDRNYLFGRLLAVADHSENYALFIKGMNRDTNAKRYMRVFAQRPFRTWQIIAEKLIPYYAYLPKAKKSFYENEIHEIMQLFKQKDFNDMELNGTYLLGYHNQLEKLKERGEHHE